MNPRVKSLNQDEIPLTIISDLGIVGGKRKAIFKCKYCSNNYTASVNDVKQGKSTRCKPCTLNNRASVRTFTTEKFINEANLVHNFKYDYSKADYVGTDIKLLIHCEIHGDFEQRPHQHLRGEGCKLCGYEKVSKDLTKDFEDTITVANGIHHHKYTYEKESYKGVTKKMTIICPKHGSFQQALSEHIHSKHGCPACKPGGFASNLPGLLYYIKLTDFNLYKIGVTNKGVTSRFHMEDIKYEILFQYHFLSGKDCIDTETLILNNYKEYIYTGPSILTSGNTEIFTKDIFKGEYNAVKSDIYRKNLSSKRNVSRCQYTPPC